MLLVILAQTATCVADEVLILDASFAPGYEVILRQDPLLLQLGGAKIVEHGGDQYFISVGVTSIHGDEALERVRQLRVARIQALREIASFTESTQIVTKDELSDTKTIKNDNGHKTANATLTLNESTVASIKAIAKSPPEVGFWKSADKQLFFYAVGTKLR